MTREELIKRDGLGCSYLLREDWKKEDFGEPLELEEIIKKFEVTVDSEKGTTNFTSSGKRFQYKNEESPEMAMLIWLENEDLIEGYKDPAKLFRLYIDNNVLEGEIKEIEDERK